MRKDKLPSLHIGNLEINPPIIQGGMGVRVSRAGLAVAVANQGSVGVIASVGLGKYENAPGSQFTELNELELRAQIRKTRKATNGVIGVNAMVALSNYENLVRASADEGVDLIISGAGLPLELPKYTMGSDVKLVPIVSSGRALQVICKKWKKNYDRLPDAVVVEGSKAGGHLGFNPDDVISGKISSLEQIVTEVIEKIKELDLDIPVIAAGGIYTGEDIARFLKLGASGVQMATRFVCTHECDVHDNFKQAYINAKEGDITVIKSPVGLPGRVINSDFVQRIKKGETIPFKCQYRCLKSCNPKTAPYCIAKVLAKASDGSIDEAFVFAGSNAYRCEKIVSVKELIDELVAETIDSLYGDK
jgi:nitronate monooxygenase